MQNFHRFKFAFMNSEIEPDVGFYSKLRTEIEPKPKGTDSRRTGRTVAELVGSQSKNYWKIVA